MPTESRMFIFLEHDDFNAYCRPRHHSAVHDTAHHQRRIIQSGNLKFISHNP